MYVSPGANYTMDGGEISNNSAYYGGAVCLGATDAGEGTFTMNNGVLTENRAYEDGGAVYAAQYSGKSYTFGGEFYVNGGVISKNTAKYGGAIFGDGKTEGTKIYYTAPSVKGISRVQLKDVIITENQAEVNGGAIFLHDSDFCIDGTSAITNNTAGNGAVR